MSRTTIRSGLITGLLVLGLAGTAHARCRLEWDCTGGYPCRQVQVCDSTIDLPALPSPGISPIPAPTIPPIPRPVVPPVGTTSCQPTYICRGGVCGWQTLCQ